MIELFSYLKSKNLQAKDILASIYAEFGVHKTKQVSFRFDSVKKAQDITEKLINQNPKNVGNFQVIKVEDMKNGIDNLPSTSGVRLTLKNARIIVRPSGTEPKLKCYLEVFTNPGNVDENLGIAEKQINLLDSLEKSKKIK